MPARRIRSSRPDLDLPPASSPDPLSDVDPRCDRRRFIRSSAIAVAGLIAASALPMDPVLAALRDHHIHFGAGCEPQGSQDQRAAVLELERKIDRKLGIMRRYTFWECDIPDGTHQWAAANGRTPYISWHAYTRGRQTIPWRSIAQGDHDAYIRNKAHTIKAWGKHVYLSFHHEPENDPANGGPAEFRAASDRVHTLFQDVGADNVTWVVALMASTYGGGHGGANVWLPRQFHLVGVDGYNRYPCDHSYPWRSFREIFNPARQWARRVNKGLFIGEYGCVEKDACGGGGAGGAKAVWFQEAADTMASWPEVQGAVYSHTNGGSAHIPYWADTSASALQAFREMAHRPRFHG